MILASAAAVLLTLFTVHRLWSRWALDVINLFCIAVLLFYGVRSVFIATGLDTPFLDRYLFAPDAAIVQTNVLIALFLLVALVGLVPGTAIAGSAGRLLPSAPADLPLRRILVVTAALSALSLLVLGWLVATYGGFDAIVRASKLEKDLAGTFVLKVIPGIGAVVAVVGYLSCVRRRTIGDRPPRWLGPAFLALSVVNAVCVLAWGARSVLAIVGFTLLSGRVVFGGSPRRGRRSGPAMVLRLAGVALLVVGLVYGLRIWRDVTLIGRVNTTIEDQSPIRQISVAANMTQYDAFVLVSQDFPDAQRFRGSQGFVDGAVAWVPRVLWEGKPDQIVPGIWLRRVYDVDAENGWPMGTTGEWYLHLGEIGVVLGGLLTGLVLGVARQTYRDSRTNPFNYVSSVVVALLVLDGGLNTQAPTLWIAWCLPLILIGWWLGRGRSPSGPPDAAAGSDATEVPVGAADGAT